MTVNKENVEIHPLKDVAYGAVSGIIGKFVEFPFDTIKVRLQSSQEFSKLSTLETIKRTYEREGFFNGFYKGIKAPLVGACMETAVLFSAYNMAAEAFVKALPNKNYTNESLPLSLKCVCGGVSGGIASFVLTPVELVKCKLQVSNIASVANTNSYSSIIKDILSNNGVVGLWHGLGSTLVREVWGTAIWFGSYEYVSGVLKKNHSDGDLGLLFSGASAGIAFNFSMFPIDTIKSKLQTHDILNANSNQKYTFINATRDLLAQKGHIRNLYNGLTITLVRCIPANALIFYSYEVLKRNF